MTSTRSAFGAEFAVPAGYLNNPSIGIPPRQVAEAVAETVARWSRGESAPPDFDKAVAIAREAFGQLVGVPGERVASGVSVSHLVANVAAGLNDGAKVLVAKGDFTSVTFPFAAQAHRGVTVTEVDLAELPGQLAGYDLVAVSVVQSADGSIVDLEKLRETAEATGTAVLLDATQGLGWLPLDLGWADWVVGAGYKFLLSPRGSAWLAVHPRVHERTLPVSANWYAGEDPWQSVYGLPLRLAGDARAFDLSPVWFAQAGAAVALPYLASLDMEAVRAHNVGLADTLLTKLGLPERGTAIVALDGDADRFAEAGVIASVRAGKVRVGFHLYNDLGDVERVLHAIG
ncbi:aminotransferase class V-fold PLP-dependent enzyme [Amycolatopsis sp. NPDC059657]|uniref:aminotransferase class V-fold PLP-dependent enzyme n=1 Tax=Amycolatopsis sp. NPDC059657 TaxID=3346899 RepID=UPI00366D95D6